MNSFKIHGKPAKLPCITLFDGNGFLNFKKIKTYSQLLTNCKNIGVGLEKSQNYKRFP